ncbi:hypothetical protein ACFL04_01045 [Patescibacteria group bacterium]
MNKKIVLYVVIVLIAAGAVIAGGWFFFLNNEEASTTTTNATPVTPKNTNTQTVDTVNLNVNADIGDIEVTKTISHKGIDFNITSALDDSSWRGDTAPSGQKYVVVYYERLATADLRDINSWLRTDAKLLTGSGQTVSLSDFKIVGTNSAIDDTGFLAFLVDAGESNFSVGFGDASTPLGF